MWCWYVFVLLAQLFARSASNDPNDAITNAQNLYNSSNVTGLLDIETPRGKQLSAIYKKSFAYDSINERLPLIFQRTADRIEKNREEIAKEFGPESLAEVQKFIDHVRELRREILANNPLTILPLANSDFDIDIARWNEKLNDDPPVKGNLTFFNSPFLLSECYMYRRINQVLARTKTLKNFDPFDDIKKESFIQALESIKLLSKYTLGLLNRGENSSEQSDDIVKLLKVNLWGNRYDLSISGGSQFNSSGNPIDWLELFEEDLVIDNTNVVYEVLSKSTSATKIVDIVLDNAGFELFTDLCFASYIISHGLAHKVRFYVKRMPWLLSDVNRHDIIWTVDYMKNSTNHDLKMFGDIIGNYFENNVFTIEVESFWTEPYDFGSLRKKSPALYAKLSQARLVVIKGDLNYRKLIGDINWDYTTTFETVLNHQDFKPTNVVSLRTFKSDICIGLKSGQAEKLKEKDNDWLVTGKYGSIIAFNIQ